jgi:hypothetical protein
MVEQVSRLTMVGPVGRNFHESFSQGEIKPPSERATGLVFAAMAAIIAWIWRETPAILWSGATLAALLVAISLLSPAILKPLNILWFQFSLLLHRIVNPLVMFILFAVVIVPAGFLMRIWYDPLRSKRAKDVSTYWISRDESIPKGSMTNQF